MATVDFISLSRTDPAATEASDLLNVIRDMRSVYERLAKHLDKMDHNFNNSGGEAEIDWAQVERLWGVPPGATSVGPGANGSRIFTFLNGSVGAIEGTFQTADYKNMTETVG